MATTESEAAGQRAADLLALALEEVGFDVGLAFPLLRGGAGVEGAPVVDLGRITVAVASDLALVLREAANGGITLDS
jgi:hypothetical protein